MSILSQQVDLQIRALVSGVEQVTSLGGALNTVKLALAGLSGALFLDQLQQMALEADKATKNTQLFAQTIASFGGDVEKSTKQANDFAVSLGISRNVMQEHLAQLVQIGISFQDSIKLTNAALDSAAARGVKAEVALENLQAAMVIGDSIYLNQLGIIKNFDEGLDEYAKSHNKARSALTGHEEAEARMNLILKESLPRQGAYAKSMQGIVGQMSQMESMNRDLRRSLGDQFLPILIEVYKGLIAAEQGLLGWVKSSDLVKNIAGEVKDVVTQLVGWFLSLDNTVKTVKDNFDVFNPVIVAFREGFYGIVDAFSPLTSAFQNIEAPSISVRDVMQAIANVMLPIAEIASNVGQNISKLSDDFDVIAVALGGAAAAWLVVNGAAVASAAGSALAAGGVTLLSTAIGGLSAFLAVLASPITLVAAALAALYFAWKNNFLGIRDYTDAVFKDLKDGFEKFKSDLDKLGAVWRLVTGIISEVWVNTWQIVGEWIDKAKVWFTETIPKAWEHVKEMFAFKAEDSPLVTGFKLLPNLFMGVIDHIGKLWEKAKSFFSWLRQEKDDQSKDSDSGSGSDSDTAPSTESGKDARYPNNASSSAYTSQAESALGKAIVEATFGKTGNRQADAVVEWCARWTRLTLEKAQPFAVNQIEKWFGGDANQIKNRIKDSGKMRTNLSDLKPGDVVIYDDNHVGIYIGNGMVRGNNRVSNNQTGQPVGNVKMESLGSIAGYARLSDFTGSTKTGASNADSTNDAGPQTTKLKAEALIAEADKWAKKIMDLQKKIDATKDETVKGQLGAQLKTLMDQAQAWQKTQELTYDLVMARVQRANRLEQEALDKAKKARYEAQKAADELDSRNKTVREKQEIYDNKILTSYDNAKKEANGNLDKLLAVDRQFRSDVIAARQSQLRNQTQAQIEQRQNSIRDLKVSKDGTVLPVTATQQQEIQAQWDIINQLKKNLPEQLKQITIDYDQGAQNLSKQVGTQNAQLLAESTKAGVQATKTTADQALNAVERQYLEEVRLAEGNKQTLLDIEKKYGTRLTTLKNNQAKADYNLAVTNENLRFQEVEKKYSDLKKSVPQNLVQEHQTNLAKLSSDYQASLTSNKNYASDLMKRASQDLQREIARAQQDQSKINIQNLNNQLQQGQILFETFERQRLDQEVKGIQAEGSARLVGQKQGSAEYLRIQADTNSKVEAARIASDQKIQEHQQQTEEVLGSIAQAQLQNQLSEGLITRTEFADKNYQLQVASLNRDKQAAIRANRDGKDGIERINAQFLEKESAARIAFEKSQVSLQIQLRKEALADELADLQLRREMGEVSQTQFNQKVLDNTLARLENERKSAIQSNQDGADGLTRIWEDYWRQRTGALFKYQEQERALELEENSRQIGVRSAALQNKIDSGSISAEDAISQGNQLSLDKINNDWQVALSKNRDGLNGQYKIYQEYSAKIEALNISQETKDRNRKLASLSALNDYQISLYNQQATEGLITQTEANSKIDGIELSRLQRTYDNEIKYGNLTAEEKVNKWNALQLQLQSITFKRLKAEYDRQRQIDNDLRQIASQTDSNKLERGEITSEQFDVNERQRTYEKNLDTLNATRGASGSDEESRALDTFAQAEIAADIAVDKKKRDLRNQSRITNLNLDLQAIDTAVTYGTMSEEKAQEARLLLRVKSNQTQMGIDLENTQLNEQQRLDIIAKANSDEKALYAEFFRWQKDYARNAAQERSSAELSLLDQQFQAGMVSQKDYLDQRESAEILLADRTLAIELEKAGENEDLQEAAYTRWTTAVLGITTNKAKTELKIEQDKLKAINDLQSRYNDEAYADGLLTQQEYLDRQLQMTLDNLELERTARKNEAGADATAIDQDIDQKGSAARNQRRRTQAEIDRQAAVDANSLQFQILEEFHAESLTSEENYLKEKERLTLESIELERKAALAKPGADAAAINAKYDALRTSTINGTTRALVANTKALRDQLAGVFSGTSQWVEYGNKLQDINDKLGKSTDEQEKKNLKWEKFAVEVQMYGEAASTAITIGLNALVGLGGMSGEVADQWGEDLGRMVNDIVNTTMEIGKAIATGNWVGAIVSGINVIFSWLSRNAKAAQAEAKAVEDYGKQFAFSKDGYGTRKVEVYTTGVLLWQTTHYKETVDEAGKALALSLESAFSSGVASGMEKASTLPKEERGLAFKEAIYNSLKSAVLKGITDAFLASAAVAELIAPLIKKLMDAVRSGNSAALREAIGEFKTGLAKLSPELEALAEAGALITDAFTIPESEAQQMFKSIKEGIQSAFTGGISSGIKEAIKSGNVDNIGKAIKESVGSSILDALVDQFIKSTVIQAIIGPAMDKVAKAILTPGTEDDEDAYATLNAAIDQATQASDKFVTAIRPGLEKAGLLGNNAESDKKYTQEDADLARLLNDGDPSNDEAALAAYRQKVGAGGSASSSTYTIGSAGTISSSGENPFVSAMDLFASSVTSISTAGNNLLQASQTFLQAANISYQAAQMMLQAAGQGYLQTTERMTFDNRGMLQQ